MSLATVHALRLDRTTAADALSALDRHLGRCKLSANTVKAYRLQATAYVGWLVGEPHPDAFVDQVGAEAAMTAWRRARLAAGDAPASVNQALAAVTLMYKEGCRIQVDVKRVRVPKPGAPKALTSAEEGALRRAADRRCVRDAAIVATLLGSGARLAECARLTVDDIAVTARTGTVRLFGKGDEVRTVPLPVPVRERLSAWMLERPAGRQLWSGTRGPMGTSGITKVVLSAGRSAGVEGLRPHRLRHTYATRLREQGADVAQIQALLGHSSIETSARYFRASAAELAALVDRALDY